MKNFLYKTCLIVGFIVLLPIAIPVAIIGAAYQTIATFLRNEGR